MTVELKKCYKCGEVKLVKEFHRNKTRKDGFCSDCKKCRSEYRKKYYQINMVGEKVYRKEYCRLNPDKVRKGYNEHIRKKRTNSLSFRLNENMSAAVRQSLKGNKNGHHWENLVNYTLDDLKRHLESQFQEGMMWENHGKGKGKWHIDHIYPISKFNMISIKCEDFKKCWSLSNLQPLWGIDNLRKHNKLNFTNNE